jgi:hypothetical protein
MGTKFDSLIIDEFAKYMKAVEYGDVDTNNVCPIALSEDKREMVFRERVDQYVRDLYKFTVQACVGCCFIDEIREPTLTYIKRFKYGGCPCRILGEDESFELLQKFLQRIGRR